MKLRYGTTSFEIHPAFSPTVNFKAEEGDNDPATIEEVWDIEGSFKADGWAALIAEWNNLTEKLRVPAQDFAILTDADAVVYELKAEDCINGPTCKVTSVTEKRKAFLVTNIRFRLTIRAEYKNPDIDDIADVRGKVDFSFRFDSLGFMTITERGVAKGTRIQDPPSPWLRPAMEAFQLDSDHSLSKDRTECRYTYKWTERKVELPAAIRDLVGNFSLSIDERSVDDFLYNEINVSGNCRIKRADTADKPWQNDNIFVSDPDGHPAVSRPSASDFIPVESIEDIGGNTIIMQVKEWIEENLIGSGVKILSKQITADLYDQRISFRFRLIKASSGLARYDYNVSIKEAVTRKNVVPIYASKPVIQTMGYSASEIREEGTMAMFEQRPPHPSPLWPELCTSADVRYPKPTSDSEQEPALMPISFSFTYQKDEFGLQDLLDLILERSREYAIPVALF